ncbi:hypothetical protein [Salinicoccus roseus]|uniref:hypothetical protein n=1 Tax=Salinicoccus roseus TaxID=45670 RepID=UPI00356A9459
MTKTNIAYQIINHLRKGIVSGNAKREALMETALSHELGFSRRPVRDALGEVYAGNFLKEHSKGPKRLKRMVSWSFQMASKA